MFGLHLQKAAGFYLVRTRQEKTLWWRWELRENCLEKVEREVSNRWVRGWSKGMLKEIDMLWGQVVKYLSESPGREPCSTDLSEMENGIG